MVGSHKAKSTETQTEIYPSHRQRAMPVKARAYSEFHSPRQRRPSHTTRAFAPGHPRRRPIITRRPAPPAASKFVIDPTPIVEAHVAPRIIRLPKPAGVAELPVARVHVGPPTGGVGLCRHPSRSDVRHVNPLAVRSQMRPEIINRRRFGRRRYYGRWRRRGSGSNPPGCDEHGVQDCLGDAPAVKIEEIVGAKGISFAGGLDVGHQNLVGHLGLGQSNNFLHILPCNVRCGLSVADGPCRQYSQRHGSGGPNIYSAVLSSNGFSSNHNRN